MYVYIYVYKPRIDREQGDDDYSPHLLPPQYTQKPKVHTYMYTHIHMHTNPPPFKKSKQSPIDKGNDDDSPGLLPLDDLGRGELEHEVGGVEERGAGVPQALQGREEL